VTHDRAALQNFMPRIAPTRLRWAFTPRGTAAFLHARFGTRTDAAAGECKGKIAAALDRLEAELGDGDYLVGDRFTVADLTAASLLYPLVLPPEAPPFYMPDAFLRYRDGLGHRRALDWVKEMFRRHRDPGRAPVTPAGRAVELV
jgi:glutathione S-transferase